MLSFTWNSSFESLPTNALARSSIDDEIRRTKRGVSERMSLEHEWGPTSEKNDGSHRSGETQVALNGTQTERDALLDMRTGALFVRTDGDAPNLDYYNGTLWEPTPSGMSHASLNDRNIGDPHPQYMRPNGIYEVPLNAYSFDLLVNNKASSNVLLWDHVNKTTNPHGVITNPDVLGPGSVNYSMLDITIVSGGLVFYTADTGDYNYSGDITILELPSFSSYSFHGDITLTDAPHFLRSLWIDDPDTDWQILLSPNTGSSWGIGFDFINLDQYPHWDLQASYSFYRVNI